MYAKKGSKENEGGGAAWERILTNSRCNNSTWLLLVDDVMMIIGVEWSGMIGFEGFDLFYSNFIATMNL